MLDWIKWLNKLTPKERKKIQIALMQLKNKNFSDLDVKGLTNKPGQFRLRIGNKRIIFYYTVDGDLEILGGGFRGNIYK